ncbi:High cysteine membrane protein Group 1, partial [Giardia lamblia P15]
MGERGPPARVAVARMGDCSGSRLQPHLGETESKSLAQINKAMLGLLFLRVVVSSATGVFGEKCTTAVQKDTCATNKCITVSGSELCRECIGRKVPIDGICKDITDFSVSLYGCEHSSGTGFCTSCKDTAFLFYGGCYTINKAPGNLVCSKAESGKCTECRKGARSLFTNPDSSAAERCILCYDNVGFGSYKGVDGCRYCLPPFAEETSAECNWCQNEKYGPVDGVCTDPGKHSCADGACSNCYMTHIQHNGGCYEKTGAVAQKICAAKDQFQALNITACRKCALEGEVPADGRCIRAALEPKCSPDPAAAGSCADCKRGGVSYDTFLFSGGCYNTSGYVGSQLCTKVNDRAECDAWNTGDYGVFKLPDYHMAYLCSNTSAGGVQGCSRCRYDSTKKKAICYDCEYDMLAFDGMSCITGTDCKGDHRQRRCPGSSGRGCRCECADKYYRSGEQCSACEGSCLRCSGPEAASCTLCPPGQALAYTSDGEGTCGAGCTPDGTCEACGLEVDQTKYCSRCKDPVQYPLNGACTLGGGARASACLRQSGGACQQCSSGYFLMGGGCYQVGRYPGRFVCRRADGGRCVDTTDEYSINSRGELVDCSPDCETCVEGQRTQCLSCAPGRYLKKEGAAPHGACVSRADCSDGYYADHDAMECLPCGIDGCSLCHLIGASVRCS